MTKTLNIFQQEWHELQKKGTFHDNNIGLITDIENKNERLKVKVEKMKKELDYEITEDIGYPTPGSLGTYAGWERKIPTVTFEIERGLPLDAVYPKVRNAILAVV